MKLSSFLIHAHDPIGLRSWYASVVGGEMVHDFALVFDSMYLAFTDHDGLSETPSEPDRAMLGFDVPDLMKEKVRLDELGVDWVREPSAFALGMLGTIRDPEGNYLQVGHFDVDPIGSAR